MSSAASESDDKSADQGKGQAKEDCPFCKRSKEQLEHFHDDLKAKNGQKNQTLTILVGVGVAIVALVLLGAVAAIAFAAGTCKKNKQDALEYFGTAGYPNSGTNTTASTAGSFLGTPEVNNTFNPNPIVSSSDFA